MGNTEIARLRHLQDKIKNEIFKIAYEKNLSSDKIKPVPDGVYDIEQYLESYPKIMWILKEPYDDKDVEGKPCGGGWTLYSAFDNEDAYTNRTWRRMVLALYGIRNRNGKDWNEIKDKIKDNIKELKRIAFINLSKMPNYTTSKAGEIEKAYNNIWSEIVLEQIEVYGPDVIICGNVYNIIKDDINKEKAERNLHIKIKESKYTDAYRIKTDKDKTIIVVDAFHPGMPASIDLETSFVNSIIQAVLKNL